ncbi:NB-ARC domains-containing protein [Tanacetum coccineum]
MSGWEEWSTNDKSGVGDSVFPCLEELTIGSCPNLVEVSLKAPLHSLRGLTISNCGGGLMRSLVVEELTVNECDEIRYLLESEEAEASSKVLMNLRKLEVRRCKNMVSLGEKDEEEYNYGSNLLTSLSSLEVWRCFNLKHLSCPNNIETLDIKWCESMACVSFSKGGGGQKLKSVSIRNSNEKVLLKEKNVLLLINTKTMPMLQSVIISEHPNVASIIEFGGTPTPHLPPTSLHSQLPKDERSTTDVVAFTFAFENLGMSRSERKMQ